MMVTVSLLSLLCFVASVAAKTTWEDLHAANYNYTIGQLIEEFDLEIAAEDLELRSRVLHKNLMKMKKHNTADHTWKMGVNPFAHLTEREFRAMYQRPREVVDTTEYVMANTSWHVANQDLPTHVDWREKKVISDVRDRTCDYLHSLELHRNHLAANRRLQQILFACSPQRRGYMYVFFCYQRSNGKSCHFCNLRFRFVIALCWMHRPSKAMLLSLPENSSPFPSSNLFPAQRIQNK